MAARTHASGLDVAVVGAGPAGSATARRLAAQGLRVALLERTRFETPRVGESLAPAVQPLLIELGVWPAFLMLGPLPAHGTRSVWGDAAARDHSHVFTPFGRGFHVDRTAFDRMLAEQAAAAGAALRLGARVVRCARAAHGGWELEVEHGGGVQPLSAAVLIDAAGRGSTFGRALGARRALFDRLVGVAARFEHAGAAEQCYTLVEAAAEGWWYSAPFARERMVAMLMTDGDLASAAGLRAPDAWLQALERSALTRERLRGGARAWGPRLMSAVSQRLIRPELAAPWLAVGDSALAVDPISGSGVVRALRGAHAAAQAVRALLDGSGDAVEAYEAERHAEFTRYLHERQAYYDLERRWAGSDFWLRRRVADVARTAEHHTGLRT